MAESTALRDLREMFEKGNTGDNSNMIVAVDTYDYTDYPVYVPRTANTKAYVDAQNRTPMTRVMEVYTYSLPFDIQAQERRTWHLD